MDSTKTGAVEADAKNNRFVFIQDGGQLYFPKSPCTIEILSAYTGDETSVFKGQVRSCVVLSAGVEHTISARFEVIGPATWKTKSSFDQQVYKFYVKQIKPYLTLKSTLCHLTH